MEVKERASHVLSNVLLLWRTWNLHGFVLFSLCLQVFLFLAAPFRKKTTFCVLAGSVWLAYQLVGTAIDRSLVLIKSSSKLQSERAEFADLYTFWAAFLILHFGGPDTITALAMEDNNLWVRVYGHIVTLTIATLNAVLAVERQKRLLRPSIFISTMLILAAGIIKSGERVVSLTNASFVRFQQSLIPLNPNPVIDYAAVMDLHDSYKAAGVPVKFVEMEDVSAEAQDPDQPLQRGLSDAQVVIQAHHFFDRFKGMYVDMVYCCHDRKESRDLFLRLSSEDAFRVVETQMKFAFDAFYSKMPLLSQPIGQLCRWVSFSLQVVALLLWSLEYKHHFRSRDVQITRALLFGAVIIDIVAFLRLYCSDWTIARTAKALYHVPLPFRLLLQARRLIPVSGCILSRQWSESISQFNFVNYCIDERCECGNLVYSSLGAKDMMDGRRYVWSVPLTNDLRQFIFQELRYKAVMAEKLDIWEEVCSSRGSWVLRCNASNDLNPAAFEPWIMDVEYDESLIIWHIATELCFEAEEEPDGIAEKQHRILSKILSDYMLYLLVRQPKIMSGIAPAAEVIFQDTCSEARQFFHEEMERKKKVHREACKRIMKVPSAIAPGYVKGESKSVLFDACRLAKYLIKLKTRRVDQWKLMSQIWAELLCYAAAQTPGTAHVIQLCAGGELLTLVRLLMLQLGITNQFRNAKRIPRSELDVPKAHQDIQGDQEPELANFITSSKRASRA